MTYMINGLARERFADLFGLADDELGAKGARRVVADDGGFPCRVSLVDAEPGETLILLNHVSHDFDGPYRATHAILVRESAEQAPPHIDRIPPVFEKRALSFRGFDARGDLVASRVSRPGEHDGSIRELLADPNIHHVDAHNAGHGCFSARVERNEGDRMMTATMTRSARKKRFPTRIRSANVPTHERRLASLPAASGEPAHECEHSDHSPGLRGMIDAETAWAAFTRRDRAFDGRFVIGVLTTGIYCRPSCAARQPRRENVRFFADGGEARGAGLRPCKRCRPDKVGRDEAAVLAAIDEIKSTEGMPQLAELAQAVGYSPTHFQRVFTRATGLSPAAYARALREERAREALSSGRSVTEAIYEAGFEAPSRFYDALDGKLGMAPSAWARGGEGVRINWAVVATSLGPMLVAATDKGVCRLSFNEGRVDLVARFPNAELVEGGAEFAALLQRVVDAVEHPGTGGDVPLDVRGTAFQERVWAELRKIPPGETRSYAEIAAAAGSPKAVRATGSANGANNVAVLIPCHRVVRSDGSLGGYAYGLDIKRELLAREAK